MQPYIWVAWDLAAVAVLAGCVHTCARRGLIRTIVNFFSYIISAAVARMLSVPAADWLYRNIARDLLELSLNSSVEKALAQNATLLETAPAFLSGLITYAFGEQAMADTLAQNSTQLVNVVIDELLRDPVLSLLQSLCFLILFSLVLTATRYLSRIFTGVYRIPVLGTVNTLLGGVLGVLQGAVALAIAGVVAHMVLVVGGDELWWLNTQVMDQTYVCRFFLKLTGFFS